MKNSLVSVLAWILLGSGMVGVIIPILPTTPFVIGAALCFAKSNQTVYQKLCQSKIFKDYIENFQNKKGIKRETKIYSLIWLWSAIIIAIILNQSQIMDIILILIAIAVSIHIMMLKQYIKVGHSNERN